jgi:sugar lactone lactonase YvrE
VTITGTNLESSTANYKLRFNITRAWPSSATGTSVSASVPSGATSGRIALATPLGNAVSSGDLFVPPYNAAVDVEVTGRISIGESRTVTINTADRIALLVFDGTAGQQVSLNVSGVTIPVSVVSVYNPDGTKLASSTANSGGATLGPMTLPATGTYTILMAPDHVISLIAGTGAYASSGDGGAATSAGVAPIDVAVDGQGNLFIADTSNNRVRKVSADGTITTVAGNGNSGYSGDGGPATSAQLWAPWGVAVDSQGNLFIADDSNNRVRKVSAAGIITTVAGTGVQGYSGDGGPATSAQLWAPLGVTVDGQGNLFIADAGNNMIRKVSASGVITTVAGSVLVPQLDSPMKVALDSQGNLFIADRGSNRIQKLSPDGTITTVAGMNDILGYSGDGGPGTSALLRYPGGVAVDGQGNLLLSDTGNNRIRKVSPDGTITTVAGSGVQGYSGDGGPATGAQLNGPDGLAVDSQGNLFIADSSNRRVRKRAAASSAGSMSLTLTSP